MFRLKGLERFQILVKGSDRDGAIASVRSAVERTVAAKVSGGVRYAVDVDPQ